MTKAENKLGTDKSFEEVASIAGAVSRGTLPKELVGHPDAHRVGDTHRAVPVPTVDEDVRLTIQPKEKIVDGRM